MKYQHRLHIIHLESKKEEYDEKKSLKKILSLCMVAGLVFFFGCDDTSESDDPFESVDTSDSPELSEDEAEQINQELFTAINSLYEENSTAGSTRSDLSQEREINEETDAYSLTGTIESSEDGSSTIYMEITFKAFSTETVEVTEGSITYDININMNMETFSMTGNIDGKFLFNYKDSPYICAWNYNLDNDGYTGTYTINGTEYDFDYEDSVETVEDNMDPEQ